MEEPLDDYVQSFERARRELDDILEATVDLRYINDQALSILTSKSQAKVFRYLAGPPISEDDLKTLVNSSIAPTILRKQPELVDRIVSTVLLGLDGMRFPWVREHREPTEDEKLAATIATAALIAYQETATLRRNAAKKAQEESVATMLQLAGLSRITISKSVKNIRTLAEGPQRGEFCGEISLSGRKADLIVGLYDNRVMPIECKVSNSSTNSVKRILNDAAAKAETWRRDLGLTQIVPVAVLAGVFKVHNLEEAQTRGLMLFWAHRLKDLTSWIENTRT